MCICRIKLLAFSELSLFRRRYVITLREPLATEYQFSRRHYIVSSHNAFEVCVCVFERESSWRGKFSLIVKCVVIAYKKKPIKVLALRFQYTVEFFSRSTGGENSNVMTVMKACKLIDNI